jgi:hypothetical protein
MSKQVFSNELNSCFAARLGLQTQGLMSITLNFSPEMENELTAEATRLGLPLDEYIRRILCMRRVIGPAPRTGAELVAYWSSEGVIGSRSDLGDSQQHARALRQRAEKRPRE